MSRLRVAFLGQCHTTGYAGVQAHSTFPEVCRAALQAARPQHTVEILLEPYGHPAELPDAVTAALKSRPRVIVVEVVGWLAIAGSSAVDLRRLPPQIRSAYDRVRHMRRATRMIQSRATGSGLIHAIHTHALALASSVVRPLLPRLPRPTVAEYESCVSHALALAKSAEETTMVVQGPGSGNFAAEAKTLPADAIARYRAVREMARRVAEKHGALYIDRWDTVGSGFFIPGTTRPTVQGHEMWGHLLAEQLLRSGIV